MGKQKRAGRLAIRTPRAANLLAQTSRGSAYIMVVFVSVPIFFAALVALAVSINSRSISARHTELFGAYELASAANIFAMLVFEEAYLANRDEAHKMALPQFIEIPKDACEAEDACESYDTYEGDDIYEGDNAYEVHEASVILPADYVNYFRGFLLPMIWGHLEESFGQRGNVLTRQFEIKLCTDAVFYGTMSITKASGQISFLTTVYKGSDNPPLRAIARGIIEWPRPVGRRVELSETFQIKNLDYFTPWVVELLRR